jgi:Tol biopolymer transport system component
MVMNADGTSPAPILDIRADGTDYRNIIYGTEHTGFDFHAAWSPDGAQFVFSSAKAGNLDLCVMNAHATDIRQVTSTPPPGSLPSWSR